MVWAAPSHQRRPVGPVVWAAGGRRGLTTNRCMRVRATANRGSDRLWKVPGS